MSIKDFMMSDEELNQELAELRERYPDALFQAEDLSRQVELLETQVKRLEADLVERPTFDELERELNVRWDEDGDCSKQAQYVIRLFEKVKNVNQD